MTLIPIEHTTAEEREMYSQGMREGVRMFAETIPALENAGYGEFAADLAKMVEIANRKIEDWAEKAAMP